MSEILIVGGIVAVWLILQFVLLPRLGIRT
jgi:hypothetical protein